MLNFLAQNLVVLMLGALIGEVGYSPFWDLEWWAIFLPMLFALLLRDAAIINDRQKR